MVKSAMGNPNPSPETRFGGPRGNPIKGGKTSKQKKLEYEAAEMAAKIRHAQLSSIVDKINQGADATEFVDPAVLKLLKDSEDRAHGTPKQAIEASGPDGGPIQTQETGQGAAKLAAALDRIAERSGEAGKSSDG